MAGYLDRLAVAVPVPRSDLEPRIGWAPFNDWLDVAQEIERKRHGGTAMDADNIKATVFRAQIEYSRPEDGELLAGHALLETILERARKDELDADAELKAGWKLNAMIHLVSAKARFEAALELEEQLKKCVAT